MLTLPCFFLLLLYSASSTSLPTTYESTSEDASRNASLQWAPYRPNLYFGMRARTPDSPLIGLMWAREIGGDVAEDMLRHTCEQSDGMDGYGWTTYDPRRGGSQTIHDSGNELDLTTDLVRGTSNNAEDTWAVRVKGMPRTNARKNMRTRVILYIGMEGLDRGTGVELDCANSDEAVHCRGSTPDIGSFQLSIARAKSAVSSAETKLDVWSLSVPDNTVWEAKRIYIDQRQAQAETVKVERKNIHFVEMSFEGAFKFDVLYSSNNARLPLRSADLTNGMASVLESYTTRFHAVYDPQHPFREGDYAAFSKALLSNLLGGIGYFYGDSRTDRSNASEYLEKESEFWKVAEEARARQEPTILPADPAELFSLVPSRPFFPRGFLWDDGFHLLLVLEWDLDLAMGIVTSWFNRMDDDGWIAREQILGPEARSKVPREFQVQYPHYANPPTLFLVVAAFCDILTGKTAYRGHDSQYMGSKETATAFLKTIYPLMKQHYRWFRRTQSGDMSYTRPQHSGEGYRWRGRTPQHTLTSGLGDYPRSQMPHPGELHVDAISWVGAMAEALAQVAMFHGEDAEQALFSKQLADIRQSITALHWSADQAAFCDATIEDENKHTLVCHKGYVSLFPFMLGHIDPTDHRTGAVLDMIRDADQLWSPYGIRSLSKQDRLYGTAEIYWRSPIWININYLILKQLLVLTDVPGPFQSKARQMYTELRENVVNTVYTNWRNTDFAWEQYNPETGAGQRTQHFTGWTALVVKIIAMPKIEVAHLLPQPEPKVGSTHKTTFWLAFGLLLACAFIFRRRLMRSC